MLKNSNKDWQAFYTNSVYFNIEVTEDAELALTIFAESEKILVILKLLNEDLSNIEIANNLKIIVSRFARLFENELLKNIMAEDSAYQTFLFEVHAHLLQQEFINTNYNFNAVIQNQLLDMQTTLQTIVDFICESFSSQQTLHCLTALLDYLQDVKFFLETIALVLASRSKELPVNLSPRHYREQNSH